MGDFFSVAGLFTLGNLFTLLMLVALQAVLGFDNLLYISMESKTVAKEDQSRVRRTGVLVAIALRIILLFILMVAIKYLQRAFWQPDWGVFKAAVNVHSLIVLFGGGFIVYTAVKEVFHMLAGDLTHESEGATKKSALTAIFWIVVMNLVFSFDSILSAIALTDVFLVMATAIVISGVMMLWLSDKVAGFLAKNRMYEVLGLFVLLLVGIMLISEGAHLARLEFFGYSIHAMEKATFYFVLVVLVVVDLIQGKYQKRLLSHQDDMIEDARAD